MTIARSWLFIALAGCAPTYAYSFGPAKPVVDADLAAQIVVDPATDSVSLDLTNQTDQVLQVEWASIAITGLAGRVTPLRPDHDLGWIQPGATANARLFPLALPRKGDAAAAYEGQTFDLDVPVVVRREGKHYHFSLVAHVRKV